MVDLDGAKAACPVNGEIFLKVAKESPLLVEVGGGIRDMKTIEWYLENGISRVILGSTAIKNPALTKEAVKTFGDKIAVGIDAKEGIRRLAGKEYIFLSGAGKNNGTDGCENHYLYRYCKRRNPAGCKSGTAGKVERNRILQDYCQRWRPFYRGY